MNPAEKQAASCPEPTARANQRAPSRSGHHSPNLATTGPTAQAWPPWRPAPPRRHRRQRLNLPTPILSLPAPAADMTDLEPGREASYRLSRTHHQNLATAGARQRARAPYTRAPAAPCPTVGNTQKLKKNVGLFQWKAKSPYSAGLSFFSVPPFHMKVPRFHLKVPPFYQKVPHDTFHSFSLFLLLFFFKNKRERRKQRENDVKASPTYDKCCLNFAPPFRPKKNVKPWDSEKTHFL